MSTYKLYYFNGRGRAESTRLIFAAAGATYEDIRVTNWPETKSETPIGNLPYLEVDGVKIAQSLSIARFVAKRFNLAGSDDLSHAKADAIVDTVSDLVNGFSSKVYAVKEDARDQVKKDFINTEAQHHFTKIEKLITLYGSNGFSVGSSLTWADLVIYETVFMARKINPQVVDGFPHILGVLKSVEANPNVAAYLKSRPDTPF